MQVLHKTAVFLVLAGSLVSGAEKDETQPAAASSLWSLQPILRPPTPSLGTGWSRNPIDAFIGLRLHQAGLAPSPEADSRTLIRRATFDLLGLPPETGITLDRPGNWDRYVDRLLASPHYGERWGRHWLDVARYADNKGYVFFEDKIFPWAWTYRDYVIESFNHDLPYDQFVLEQLAADQLDLRSRPAARAAMGFLTLGGRFMNNLHDMLDDQIDVVTRGLLGLTLTCARCHDHKYDPITQSDYYSLYGVFRSSSEPLVPPQILPVPDTAEYRKFASELESRNTKLRDFIITTHTALVAAAKSRVAEYMLEAQRALDQPPTDDFMLLTEAGGLNPTVVLRWRVYLERLESRAVVEAIHDPVWAPWQALAALDASTFAARSAGTLRRLVQECAGDTPLNPRLLATLQKGPLRSLDETATIYGRVFNAIEREWQALRATAIKARKPLPSGFPDPTREQLRQVFHSEQAPSNIPRVFGWGALALLPDRPAQATYKTLRKALAKWLVEGKGAPARAMILKENTVPYQPRIFDRGNAHRPGQFVSRQLPRLLAGPDHQPFRLRTGRLELARAIASADTPLTPRVLVNRVWMHHFGQGLVRTPSDFGTRGQPPTHPLLLDYLADWFVHDAAWSIKSLHRLIMTSATYRQQSQHREQAFARDPGNRLLWRMPRRRLGFEAMRDSQLVFAGNIDRRMGGQPVKIFKTDTLQPRRSVYGFIDRMNPPPLLRTFDVPNPLTSCGRRDETTIAPQALHLMNSTTVQECAGRLAARTTGVFPQRLTHLYQLVYTRSPSNDELKVAARFMERFGDDSAGAWTALAHTLLISNEAQFID